MQSALIVSRTEKGGGLFTRLLDAEGKAHGRITVAHTCAQARLLLSDMDFDLVVVSAPLCDETGEALARQIARKGASQVILAVSSELCGAVSALVRDDGIFTLSKPVNKNVFRIAVGLADAAQSRTKTMRAENDRLKQQLEELRLVCRAKCLLVSCLHMTEHEAHRYIEKQAMDTRASKREVVQGVLRAYGK